VNKQATKFSPSKSTKRKIDNETTTTVQNIWVF